GDTHRDLRVSTTLADVTARMIFLPVWLAAFAYKQKVYRFVVNGQTGKVTGEAPLSYFKIALVAGAVLIAILLVVVLAALMSK
ncbi:MAG: primosomal protein N' (replication factor Y) - superfamily II helicase, partial [Acidobacteria bacterium]|nr:primosomal protein N' (replication factor Y) - superfamily II helicase [Acidobacteriota bacterium]